MWTLLGVAASERIAGELEKQSPLAAGRDRALGWLKDRGPRTRNDWLAWRMLVEQRYGANDKVQSWRERVLAQQNDDGG